MELTSQAINEAEFSMARRGYDPDQVDEFLEKLAVGVDKQSEALGEARERAAMAERRAAEAERRASERPERVVDAGPGSAREAGPSAAEVSAAAEAELETLKRTLVLAQKTADATIRDAEDEARQMIAAAEQDARDAQEGTRARLLQEIGALDEGREALASDVAALERHLEEQRARLRSSVADLQRLLDEPDRLKAAPTPALAGPGAAATQRAAAGQPAEAPATVDDDAATSSEAEAPADEAAPRPERPRFTTAEDGNGGHAPADDADGDDIAAGDDDGWARFGVDDEIELDAGPPTEPVLRLDDLERESRQRPGDGEDAYLTELRKAMLDDTGAPGVREAFGDEHSARPRFGRRR